MTGGWIGYLCSPHIANRDCAIDGNIGKRSRTSWVDIQVSTMRKGDKASYPLP